MNPPSQSFSKMRGNEVLTYLRDVVLTTAAKRRSLLEQSAAIGGSPISVNELAEARALDVAADLIQFALSAGQEASTKGKQPPDWIMRMVAQARVALIAPED